MKTLTLAVALLAITAGAQAQTGVSISIGQPGFFGRIDVGDYPAPELLYPQPIIVQRPSHYAGRPIYLRVPPGYAQNWPRYCRVYNACNQEVYFVQDRWYTDQFIPRYRQQHPDRYHGRPGYRPPPPPQARPNRPDDRHDNRPGDRPGNRPGNDRGPGDRGPGNDRGNDRGGDRGGDRR